MIDLSISIVSHNSRKDLELLMPSLQKALKNIQAEVLLVDNASDDASVEFIKENYSEVVLRVNTTRCGYGTNHNKNLSKIKGKYILFMNSDMVVLPDTLSKLIEFMNNHPEVGICSANVLNKHDGTLQYLNKQYPTILDLLLRRFVPDFCKSIFKTRLDYYEMRKTAYNSSTDIPFISGCFMFCRASVIHTVGGFDERYFLYFEDVDLCRSVQKYARTVSCPESEVFHRWERSAHKEWKWFIIFIKSAIFYFNKWGYILYKKKSYHGFKKENRLNLWNVASNVKNNYKVSVITVVYNCEKTIEDSILSVAQQVYPHIEHIIIDGASTDNTMAVITKHKDKIRHIVSESDNGMYDAMNKGIKLASGDVIGILNADDVYYNSYCIDSVVREFQKKNSIQAVCGDLVFVSQKKLNKIVRYYNSKYFQPYMFSYGIMPAHPAFFVKKQCYEKYGVYKIDYTIAADFELLLRFISTYGVSYAYLPKVLVKMRLGGISTSGFKSNWIINKEIVRACKENKIKTSMTKVLLKYFIKFFQLIRRPSYK